MNPIPRTVLAGLALLAAGAAGAAGAAAAAAAAADDGRPAGAAAGEAASAPVIARARRALRDSGVDASALELMLLEPATWPDSSLGCPKRGLQYLQVLTAGYRVRFGGAGRAHEVHVAGDTAVVCDGAGMLRERPHALQAPMRNVSGLIDQAKGLLARATGSTKDSVQVLGFAPATWPDGALGCAGAASAAPSAPVAGYRIVLGLAGRSYTFHSDGARVLACPPIEDR